MALNWSSWNEFVAMGGYAAYVWGSFGVVLLVLAAELLQLAMRKNAVKRLAAQALQPGDDGAFDATRPQHDIHIHES